MLNQADANDVVETNVNIGSGQGYRDSTTYISIPPSKVNHFFTPNCLFSCRQLSRKVGAGFSAAGVGFGFVLDRLRYRLRQLCRSDVGKTFAFPDEAMKCISSC